MSMQHNWTSLSARHNTFWKRSTFQCCVMFFGRRAILAWFILPSEGAENWLAKNDKNHDHTTEWNRQMFLLQHLECFKHFMCNMFVSLPPFQKAFYANGANLGSFKFGNFRNITLQEINISPEKSILKMIFLFPRWDMLIPWRVYFLAILFNHFLRGSLTLQVFSRGQGLRRLQGCGGLTHEEWPPRPPILIRSHFGEEDDDTNR